jgi:ribosomal protein S18 acetylase RimI-like enzyme
MVFRQNTQTVQQITEHLLKANKSFRPPLDSYIDIEEYAQKLFDKAINFEALESEVLIGLIAGYHNTEEKMFYVSNVSVDPDFQDQGIARKLFENLYVYSQQNQIQTIKLQVFEQNKPAVQLYQNLGFDILLREKDCLTLIKTIHE